MYANVTVGRVTYIGQAAKPFSEALYSHLGWEEKTFDVSGAEFIVKGMSHFLGVT